MASGTVQKQTIINRIDDDANDRHTINQLLTVPSECVSAVETPPPHAHTRPQNVYSYVLWLIPCQICRNQFMTILSKLPIIIDFTWIGRCKVKSSGQKSEMKCICDASVHLNFLSLLLGPFAGFSLFLSLCVCIPLRVWYTCMRTTWANACLPEKLNKFR